MTRLERWQRAADLGLDPPAAVKAVLDAAAADSPLQQSMWHGRV
jgi:hypothetical protein